MDQQQIGLEMAARRAGRVLLCGLNDMATDLPSPAGKTLRVTVTVISTGEQLGTEDVDSTNAHDLGTLGSQHTKQQRTRRNPTPISKPNLRLVGGAK
jgi:hypothetical protein